MCTTIAEDVGGVGTSAGAGHAEMAPFGLRARHGLVLVRCLLEILHVLLEGNEELFESFATRISKL